MDTLSTNTNQGGEAIEILTKGNYPKVFIVTLPNQNTHPKVAIVDWLSFTICPPPKLLLSFQNTTDNKLSGISGITQNMLDNLVFNWLCHDLPIFCNINKEALLNSKWVMPNNIATFPVI